MQHKEFLEEEEDDQGQVQDIDRNLDVGSQRNQKLKCLNIWHQWELKGEKVAENENLDLNLEGEENEDIIEK